MDRKSRGIRNEIGRKNYERDTKDMIMPIVLEYLGFGSSNSSPLTYLVVDSAKNDLFNLKSFML